MKRGTAVYAAVQGPDPPASRRCTSTIFGPSPSALSDRAAVSIPRAPRPIEPVQQLSTGTFGRGERGPDPAVVRQARVLGRGVKQCDRSREFRVKEVLQPVVVGAGIGDGRNSLLESAWIGSRGYPHGLRAGTVDRSFRR